MLPLPVVAPARLLLEISPDGTFRLYLTDRPVIPDVDPQPEFIPTDCEQDVIDLLTRTDRRMKIGEVVAKLESTHGESTIGRALASLVKVGILDHVSRRGYAIAEKLSVGG